MGWPRRFPSSRPDLPGPLDLRYGAGLLREVARFLKDWPLDPDELGERGASFFDRADGPLVHRITSGRGRHEPDRGMTMTRVQSRRRAGRSARGLQGAPAPEPIAPELRTAVAGPASRAVREPGPGPSGALGAMGEGAGWTA
jgi:hypothetical protein